MNSLAHFKATVLINFKFGSQLRHLHSYAHPHTPRDIHTYMYTPPVSHTDRLSLYIYISKFYSIIYIIKFEILCLM